MTRWEGLARRVVAATAAAAGVLLALAMILSYSGMRSFFLGCGFPAWAASAAPLCIDLLALVGYVALLVLIKKGYPGFIVAVGVLASAAAQGYHLSHGGITADVTDGRVIFAAGAAPMISAGLAGHLLWLILERALPAGFITAMRGQGELEREAELPTQPPTRLEAPPAAGSAPAPRAVGTLAPPPRDAERTLADYPPLPPPVPLRRPAPAAARQPRAVVTRASPSQQDGPCVDDCTRHPAGTKVSKSTRYRCIDRIAAARQEAAQ